MAAVVVAAVAVRLYLITHFNVHWDEFYFLSQVHDYLRGDPLLRLQTFHVHFFGWVSRVAVNEVDQVIAGRAVMLGLHLLTTVLLYRIARRLTSAPAARFAVAAYLSVSFVIWHGASFRTDPIVTCVILGVFDRVLSRPAILWNAVLSGLLLAAAAMVTIKALIFLPALAVILFTQLLERRQRATALRTTATMGLVAIVAFFFLYQLHSMSVDGASAHSSAEVARTSFFKTLAHAGLFPRLQVVLVTLQWDMVFWGLWLVGGVVVARRARHATGSERARWIVTAALALPVASVAFYRNSFSYFYPTILAPASVLTAVAWEELSKEELLARRWAVAAALKGLALSWFAASVILHGLYLPGIMPLDHQRMVLAAIHRAFPAPTPYLDSRSMVASFPQVGFFMSTLGMELYSERGRAVLRQAVNERQPPLLIANHPLLDPENAVFAAPVSYRPPLLEPDRAALASAYIHHWGPIYVAGKRLEAPGGDVPVRLELPIAGRYTVEAHGPVRIDGRRVDPGHSVELARGPHEVGAAGAPTPVTLRWGDSLYRPAQPAPDRPLFLLSF